MRSLSDTKAVIRCKHLRRLREMAKNDPTFLQEESEKVCAVLYERLRGLRLSCVGVGKAFSSLLLCAYLPLYFEVDLRPLLRRIWWEKSGEDGMSPVSVFVPVVLTPPEKQNSNTMASVPCWQQPEENALQQFRSAMLFVEVFDEMDLLTSFERRGRYQLMEPKEEILRQSFFAGCNTEPCVPTALRRGIACDYWRTLFPECTKPEGLIDLNSLQRDVGESACLLVLAPGVLFDCAGGRIGKGGGYYDRFLNYQRGRTREGGAMLMAWGIGRETQLLSAEEPSMPVSTQDISENGVQDALMDCVVTPTTFVFCTPHGKQWCDAL